MRNEDEIREMFIWIENHPDLGKIDVCIPNAGLNQDSKLMDGNILIIMSSKLKYFLNPNNETLILYRDHQYSQVKYLIKWCQCHCQ